MKPVTFDMTPLTKALKVTRPEPPATAPLQGACTGTIPQHFSAGRGWLQTLAHEQIHALATHVLARHTEQGLRTVAITSALAGEGKTTLALALAERLATAEKRVLIIDLDTYRSALSRAARLGDRDGALESSVSNNGSTPFHAYATDRPGVSIMPTGREEALRTGIPLISPKRVLNLIRRGLEDYDLVLLDCPPLMPVAETHVIGAVIDAAVLVVRAGSTPRETLNQALEEFGREKFFAAVLNGARPADIPYFREVYGYYRRDSRQA